MNQRVRERGPRRRCSSNNTLVRTIPALQREPPPVPLLAATKRHYQWAAVSDYAGIATATWSTGTLGTSTFINQNCLYHHFTVANQRSNSYSAILPPIRYSPHASASDGAAYEGWTNLTQANRKRWTTLDQDVELCRSFLPTDSHCQFPGNYAKLGFTDPTLPLVPPSTASTSAGFPSLDSIAASTLFCQYEMSVHAVQFRVNGSAVGALQLGRQASRDYRIPIAKGDIIEFDVWYKVSYTANNAALNGPGKGYIALPTSFVTSTATRVALVQWLNLNSTPSFDYNSQTYEITIAGHSGWTLKNGSDGPHKMVTGDGWFRTTYTSTTFGSGFKWSTNSNSSNIFVRTDSEIPAILFQPGGLIFGIFGYNSGDSYMYRPTFGGSTSYRKTSVNKIVYNVSGSTNTPAGTVTSLASGVWNQAGSTVFDLNDYKNETQLVKGRGFGPLPAVLDSWIPETITLNRVPL